MDSKLLDKINDETLVDFYHILLNNLQTVERKLRSYDGFLWNGITIMVISDDFIENFKGRVDWFYISCNYPLTKSSFIERFKDDLDWGACGRYRQDLPEDFIRKYIVFFDMDDVLQYRIFSEEFLREFIRDFKDKVN